MNLYKYAQLCFASPLLPIAIHLIDIYTFNALRGYLFIFSIYSSLLCGVIGLIVTIRGITFWKRKKHNQKIDVGIAMIFFAFFYLVVGLLGSSIIYLILN